jgi:hypothetical protein
MNLLAERIIASHKDAAKRATSYLENTRRLKLSPPESLELVARVLGAPNWQTLLALAKGGRGPRVDVCSFTDGRRLLQAEKRVSERLAEYYSTNGYKGEHPEETVWDWVAETGVGLRLGYWEYVERQIRLQDALLPWEREASDVVKLVRAAGIDVGFWPEDDKPSYDPHKLSDTEPWWQIWKGRKRLGARYNSEVDAWDVAATAVEQRVLEQAKLSAEQWNKLEEAEKLKLAKSARNVGALIEGKLQTDTRRFRGAMFDSEYSTNFSVKLGRLAHRVVACNPNDRWSGFHKDSGTIYVAEVATEREVWEILATAVKEELAYELRLSHAQRNSLSESDWLAAATRVYPQNSQNK